MTQTHVTNLKINISALRYNYLYLKNHTIKNTKTLAVVKAFAYGLDPVIVAKELEKNNVDYLGVAYADEGILLRENGIKTPILVLHAQPNNYKTLTRYNLEPNIYSIYTLKQFLIYAENENLKNYPIHLKFNSGLNRLGLNPNEVDTVLDLIINNKHINVTSVMSHIAASEDLNEKDFTESQISSFNKTITQLRSKLSNSFITHMCNTSGTINYPNAHFNMIRLGIGLYGFGNDTKLTSELRNVATLTSIISQIRTVKKGDSVSYNMSFTAHKEEKIAIIPIGHADGFSRALGCGKGYVIINGQKAYTTGNVCMDMILVNITNIDCKEGDNVIIFNDQETVEDIANICNTIPYEILTSISQRIKRSVQF